MSEEDYKRGYRDGFRDCFEQIKNKPVDLINPNPLVPTNPVQTNSCPVCNLNWKGPIGYVCPRVDCPSKIWCGVNPNITITSGT